MRKLILPLIIVCFFVYVDQAEGTVSNRSYNYYPNDMAKATGTVVGMERNSIEIYDEDQKRVERFVDLGEREQFHQGEYIRVFYHPDSSVVVNI